MISQSKWLQVFNQEMKLFQKKEKVCNCDTDANSEGEYIRDDQGSLIMDCLIMWAMLGSMYHSQDDINLQCIVGFVSSS